MQEKKYDVICMGIMVVDVLVKDADEAVFRCDTMPVTSVALKTGGDAVNQSINLANMGARVGIMGLIGRDQFGETLLQALAKEGVDTALVKKGDAATGVSIVLIERGGERHFLYCGKNNMEFSDAHIDYDALAKARYVSIASLFALPGIENETLDKIVDCCRDAGSVLVADFVGISGEIPDAVKLVLPRIDWLIPSYTEACKLTGEEDIPAIVEGMKRLGAKNFIIKLGEEGCCVHTDTFSGMVPAFKANAVDTTGAGDTFAAGFIYGLIQGWDVEKSVRYACAAGSIAVESIGATGGIHSAQQVIERMQA